LKDEWEMRRMLIWGLGSVLILIGGFSVYVRSVPHDAERWHRAASHAGLETLATAGAYVWRQSVTDDGMELLAKLDAVASDTPHTKRLVGSVAEGKVTYVTRSRFMGFPDYSTIGVYDAGGQRYVEINSRLRFGSSDLGVNKARVESWLAGL
jgi:hypothetical protein